jgi:VCBS repeat-containing protein
MLGSITPSGTIATYPIGATFNDNRVGQFCTRGPDGEPWCASRRDQDVIRVDTAAHTVEKFTPPVSAGTFLNSLTTGPDGNLWVDTVGGTPDVDVLVSDPLTVKPNVFSFSAVGQSSTLTVKQTGTTHWTATSSNPAVATVVPGGTNATFTVRATGVGSCKITISDGSGNSVAVNVTVTEERE